jgi:hypothetical protein
MSTTELEQRIARLQLRIEQLRIYIVMMHPAHRSAEAASLQAALKELADLNAALNERQLAGRTPAAA